MPLFTPYPTAYLEKRVKKEKSENDIFEGAGGFLGGLNALEEEIPYKSTFIEVLLDREGIIRT